MRIRHYSIVSLLIFSCFVLFGTSHSQQNYQFPQTVKLVLPSIVKIFAETNAQISGGMTAEVLLDTSSKLYSTGTGFFVSTDGNILTAYHVISIASGPITVIQFENNSANQYPARVISIDSMADVALIKIQKSNCPALELLDPLSLEIGTEVAFVGFPLNYFFPVVSKSILSAKVDLPIKDGFPARHQLVINQFINHGNSGGPVFLASTGQVVGIVSWRPSPNIGNRLIVLPKNYQPIARIGGVDPIGLSVETYNENLKYMGELTQFGLGFVPSIEYAIPFLKH